MNRRRRLFPGRPPFTPDGKPPRRYEFMKLYLRGISPRSAALMLLLPVLGLWASDKAGNGPEGNPAAGQSGEPLEKELAGWAGRVIPRIDFDEKPLNEAVKELVDLAVGQDKNSPWRNVRVISASGGGEKVSLHLRNCLITDAFQALARTNGGTLRMENGIVYMICFDTKISELRSVVFSRQAAIRLGLTSSTVKERLQKFGIYLEGEGVRLTYHEDTGSLLMRAAPGECDLVEALAELAARVPIDVRK